ncbi:PKAR [Symbiodinium pilosum]|uniref:cAMP-dependent protein kinase regulatory subunit n=1 Tax=Symbiodinium pilosum TaxID=2952 RepID=A0A812XRG7_SYMPI|nr:PKAR [Symbiodinium pilosum]
MAQEPQEYIQQKVNPILENLVTQLLLERPEQLAPFMIKWLSQNSKTPAAAALTEGVNVLSELKLEMEKLQEEVRELEAQVEAKRGDKTGPLTAGSEAVDALQSMEESEDDEEVEDVVPPPALTSRGHRASVSAEAYGQWNPEKAFVAPVYEKSDEQKTRLANVLKESFLFSGLESPDIKIVIDAMQEKIVEKDTRLINQGEDGDCLYVVEEGQMNCYIRRQDGAEDMVKECTSGDAFGELALLYNCPRAASVQAAERSVLWELGRESFNNIVKKAAVAHRDQLEEFLLKVPLLKGMDAYERSSLCDALQPTSFAQGDVIVQQGDIGDVFYILQDGSATVSKVYVAGTPAKEVLKLGPGDYFGELALLKGEPRAASVIALTECKCYTLSRRTFNRLLGPLEEILRRNATKYD